MGDAQMKDSAQGKIESVDSPEYFNLCHTARFYDLVGQALKLSPPDPFVKLMDFMSNHFPSPEPENLDEKYAVEWKEVQGMVPIRFVPDSDKDIEPAYRRFPAMSFNTDMADDPGAFVRGADEEILADAPGATEVVGDKERQAQFAAAEKAQFQRDLQSERLKTQQVVEQSKRELAQSKADRQIAAERLKASVAQEKETRVKMREAQIASKKSANELAAAAKARAQAEANEKLVAAAGKKAEAESAKAETAKARQAEMESRKRAAEEASLLKTFERAYQERMREYDLEDRELKKASDAVTRLSDALRKAKAKDQKQAEIDERERLRTEKLANQKEAAAEREQLATASVQKKAELDADLQKARIEKEQVQRRLKEAQLQAKKLEGERAAAEREAARARAKKDAVKLQDAQDDLARLKADAASLKGQIEVTRASEKQRGDELESLMALKAAQAAAKKDQREKTRARTAELLGDGPARPVSRKRGLPEGPVKPFSEFLDLRMKRKEDDPEMDD